MTLPRPDAHLDVNEVAAFVDGEVEPGERRRIQAHLASCADCRAEVGEVGRVVRASPGMRRTRAWIPPLAAAAAVAHISLVPRGPDGPEPVRHRDQAATVTAAPRPIAPVGKVDSVPVLLWSAVPMADRYRISLFDSAGIVVWEHQTTDTAVPVPASVTFRRGSPYYWRVESHSGFDRWAESDLVEFVW